MKKLRLIPLLKGGRSKLFFLLITSRIGKKKSIFIAVLKWTPAHTPDTLQARVVEVDEGESVGLFDDGRGNQVFYILNVYLNSDRYLLTTLVLKCYPVVHKVVTLRVKQGFHFSLNVNFFFLTFVDPVRNSFQGCFRVYSSSWLLRWVNAHRVCFIEINYDSSSIDVLIRT